MSKSKKFTAPIRSQLELFVQEPETRDDIHEDAACIIYRDSNTIMAQDDQESVLVLTRSVRNNVDTVHVTIDEYTISSERQNFFFTREGLKAFIMSCSKLI